MKPARFLALLWASIRHCLTIGFLGIEPLQRSSCTKHGYYILPCLLRITIAFLIEPLQRYTKHGVYILLLLPYLQRFTIRPLIEPLQSCTKHGPNIPLLLCLQQGLSTTTSQCLATPMWSWHSMMKIILMNLVLYSAPERPGKTLLEKLFVLNLIPPMLLGRGRFARMWTLLLIRMLLWRIRVSKLFETTDEWISNTDWLFQRSNKGIRWLRSVNARMEQRLLSIFMDVWDSDFNFSCIRNLSNRTTAQIVSNFVDLNWVYCKETE